MKIRKAVIPAAGLGTRFLPATKAVPKEMIPIVDVPMIQHIVEEAVKSGIEQIVIVTARNKGAIEDHFDYNYELEDVLLKKGNSFLADSSKKIAEMCEVVTVRQKNPMGLGHAVLTAEAVIGREPFAVLLGDDLIDAPVPCTRQLIDLFELYQKSIVAVMEVGPQEVSKYGIVGGRIRNQGDRRLIEIDQLIEKPTQEQAPSCFAIPGRYVLTADIFDCLRETQPGRGGEIQLTDGLQKLAASRGLFGYEYIGERYDTGDRLGFIDATLAFALKRQDLASGVRALLKKHLGERI